MSGIERVMGVPAGVWTRLREAEAAGGLRLGDIDVKRRKKSPVEVWGWFFGIDEPAARLLPVMRAIGESLGVPAVAGFPSRSDTAPCGQLVCVTVSAVVEDVTVVVKALIDAEQYADAVAAERLTEVAA